MSTKTHTTLALALTVQLVAIAVLAGFGPVFPSGVDAAAGWRFLGGHALELAHALLGVLVLVQALILIVAARAKLVPALILTGVVVAVASGAAFVSSRQPESALWLMTTGWLVSLSAAVVELVRQRRQLKAGS
ncbi:hypothetical protein [Nocardioides sp.]|uniref:hypothetical protein n=1 Tax=Nocardioides sp. TaxID=35761 RepID=UPI003D132626